MIEKINIKEFECHFNVVLEFSKTTNCFIGETHIGKSSILRAIKWVLLNEPANKTMIPHNKKKAHVILFFKGRKIERYRDKSNNYYILDGTKYEGFGREVPEPIQKLFYLSDYSLATNNRVPFLLFDHNIYDKINKIADIDGATDVIDFLEKQKNISMRKTKENKESYIFYQNKIKKTAKSFAKANKLLEKLHQLNAEKTRITELFYLHRKLKKKIETKEAENKKLWYLLRNARLIDQYQSLVEQKNKIIEQKHLFDQFTKSIRYAKDQIEQNQKTITFYQEKLKGETCPLCKQKIL